MQERCGGRMWMAAHMRRGDFTVIGWVMENTIESHLERIRDRLDRGRHILEQITVPETNISGIVPDTRVSQLALPLEGDPLVHFYPLILAALIVQ